MVASRTMEPITANVSNSERIRTVDDALLGTIILLSPISPPQEADELLAILSAVDQQT
jgi:hypothetical protein